ncbi:MAG: hypothetical protein F6K40_25975 [Okeania sp. SIO3I5]|uniref:hypothetical protein n=1 Tax=Okeania sp. SIO3I5 TaxID=2607805 RepID=UPI0013B5E7AB|nr:hypothetical protein [Okeania sp. SIO3I5]NEQ39520.1 hypothetical protein [Okeania sp. SIO3I5]
MAFALTGKLYATSLQDFGYGDAVSSISYQVHLISDEKIYSLLSANLLFNVMVVN